MERVPRYPPFVAALTKEASRDHITSNEVFELFQNCKVRVHPHDVHFSTDSHLFVRCAVRMCIINF